MEGGGWNNTPEVEPSHRHNKSFTHFMKKGLGPSVLLSDRRQPHFTLAVSLKHTRYLYSVVQ